jgi:hypothetical protein
MPRRASKLTCEEFQRYIAEQFNSGAEAEDVERHPHAKACVACRQIVQELAIIAEAARSLFPDELQKLNKPN